MHARWFSARAVRLHVTLAILVPACAALCVWQVRRALSGNDLSWAYVFEWPFFAGYGVYMWWKLLHDPTEAATDRTDGDVSAGTAAQAPEVDEELAAYNRYLAQLNASGRSKHW